MGMESHAAAAAAAPNSREIRSQARAWGEVSKMGRAWKWASKVLGVLSLYSLSLCATLDTYMMGWVVAIIIVAWGSNRIRNLQRHDFVCNVWEI